MGGTTEASFVPDEPGPYLFVDLPSPRPGRGVGGEGVEPMIENMTIIERLAALHQKAEAELAAVADEAALEKWRIRYLGRKSGALNKVWDTLSTEERPAAGREYNRVKALLESLY